MVVPTMLASATRRTDSCRAAPLGVFIVASSSFDCAPPASPTRRR
jgi:hypothetical protein